MLVDISTFLQEILLWICSYRILLQLLVHVLGCGTQLLLDADKLVVLGHTVGAAQGTSLDLAAVGSNSDVGDSGVLSLTGAV